MTTKTILSTFEPDALFGAINPGTSLGSTGNYAAPASIVDFTSSPARYKRPTEMSGVFWQHHSTGQYGLALQIGAVGAAPVVHVSGRVTPSQITAPAPALPAPQIPQYPLCILQVITYDDPGDVGRFEPTSVEWWRATPRTRVTDLYGNIVGIPGDFGTQMYYPVSPLGEPSTPSQYAPIYTLHGGNGEFTIDATQELNPGRAPLLRVDTASPTGALLGIDTEGHHFPLDGPLTRQTPCRAANIPDVWEDANGYPVLVKPIP